MVAPTKRDRIPPYIRRGYKTVDGWASPLLFDRVLQMDSLQHQVNIHGHVGEIGVHHGKLFILLYLLRRSGERGIAIDLFEQQERNIDRSGKGNRDIFLNNVRRWAGESEAVEVMATDSTSISGADIAAGVGGKLRLLSIDGGHLREIIAHDLRTASECLADGGIVMVDDYLNPEFPGVAEGTLAFLSSDPTLRPFCVSTEKLYLTTSDYAGEYARLIYEQETGRSWDSARKYSFVRGKNSFVRMADLLDSTVICYSDDQYRPAEKIKTAIRNLRRDVRLRAGNNRFAISILRSPLGKFVRRVGGKFFPY